MRNFQLSGRSVAVGANGAAATSQPLSTYLAIEVLRRGGNAIDAALTACSLQGVLEPHNTGIGGDCFAFVWRADRQRLYAINGAGWSPEGLDQNFLARQGISSISSTSIHAVTVPGALAAWARLLEDHGRMSLAEILRPTMEYAEGGFVLAERAASDWAAQTAKLADDEGARAILLRNGAPPRAGDTISFPQLARTLRIIADEGPAALYGGTVGRALLASLHALGGRHSLSDFSEFEAAYVEPIGVDYRGLKVLEMPPSGQGLTALIMLNILAAYDDIVDAPLGARRLHLQIEAARRAFWARDSFVADPAFAEVPVAELLSSSFAERLREDLDVERASPPSGADHTGWQRDTVCLTVVDQAGNACSIVNSLFDAFGCGKVCPRTGIVLQSRGSGFRIRAGHPNRIEGRKRPLHTIIPGMVMKDDKPCFSLGVMGGAF